MNVDLMENFAQPSPRQRADSAESEQLLKIKKMKEISPATTIGQTVDNSDKCISNGSSCASRRDHNPDAIISESLDYDLNFLE